jgi:hypothetical protein
VLAVGVGALGTLRVLVDDADVTPTSPKGVEFVAPGYRMALPPGSLDSNRFTELSRKGPAVR